MKLNLGCGSHVPEGWIDVDNSLGARFAKIPLFSTLNKKLKLFDLDWKDSIFIHDLTKKFPWKNETVDVIYSSHAFEHFTRKEGKLFLTECCRVLKKNGVIRIVVPDLNLIVMEYVAGRLRADYFLEKLDVLYKKGTSKLKNRLSPFIQFPHKCMYDLHSLLMLLSETGFIAVSKNPFQSDIEKMSLPKNLWII